MATIKLASIEMATLLFCANKPFAIIKNTTIKMTSIAVINELLAAVRPITHASKKVPINCMTNGAGEGFAELSNSTPTPLAHFAPNNFGEYHSQPKINETKVPTPTASQFIFAVISFMLSPAIIIMSKKPEQYKHRTIS